MKAIIAVNRKNVIGVDRFLPWKSSSDLQHFKKLTMGCNLLVGYNSFFGIPKLDGRKVFIDAKSPESSFLPPSYYKYDYPEDGKVYFYISSYDINEDDYSNYVNEKTINNVHIDWCIGGKKTYEKYCHLFTEMHISHINDDTDGNVLYPELKNLKPECKIFNYFFDTD
jgi:dihydrofolate reductase